MPTTAARAKRGQSHFVGSPKRASGPRNDSDPFSSYYAKRAGEYERIYDKAERQDELAWLRERLPRLFAGRRVLEIACGTGYWTQYIAATAAHVTACDINEAVLEIAREKPLARGRAHFVRADAFSPQGVCQGSRVWVMR